MRIILSISLLVLLQISFQGCQKVAVVSNDQKILFQYSFVNSTWGIKSQGYVIDNEGNILVYNQPDKWNFPDKNSMLTRAQVAENLSYCTPTGKKVPQSELKKYTGYITNITSSKVTAKKNVAAGMGTFNYYCFSYSAENSTYRQVIIKIHGDVECENLNFYSKKVVEWMNQMMQGLPLQHL
jgi:hypothetical protein